MPASRKKSANLDRIGLGKTRHTQETRMHLLLVAERLFAEFGFEGVSLRQIAQESGHGNTNVVQYHFETKENLLSKLMLLRATQMEPRRAAMLEDAERKGLLGDVDTLLRIVYLPHLDLADENGRHPYAQFLSQFQVQLRPQGRSMGKLHPYDQADEAIPALLRSLHLLDERLFFLPQEIAHMRIFSISNMFLQSLIFYDARQHAGGSVPPLDEWVEDVFAMMKSALLTAPAATPSAKAHRTRTGPADWFAMDAQGRTSL